MKLARRIVSFLVLIIGASLLIQPPRSDFSQSYGLGQFEIIGGALVVASIVVRANDYKSKVGLISSILSGIVLVGAFWLTIKFVGM